MNSLGVEAAYTIVLVIARVGACLALLPGFGSARIPARVRLLLAVALSLAITPLIAAPTMKLLGTASDTEMARLMAGELLIGAGLGLMTRAYILGLQFSATLITNVLGLAATPGVPIDDTEVQSPLVSLITLTATVAIFAAGLHYQMLSAIIDSYAAIAVGSPIDPGWYLDQFLEKLGSTWSMGLRLAAPFVAFSVIVNLGLGLLNKFTPQISVYFMATGLVATLGLILLYYLSDEMISLFLQEFSAFVR